MKRIDDVIYPLLVFGAIFIDCPFSQYVGAFGRCWLNLFLPVFFFAYLVIKQKLYLNGYLKKMLYLILWILGISIITVTMFWLREGSLELYTENIIFKAFKTSVYWIDIVLYMLLFYNCIRDRKVKKAVFPFFVTYCFLFVVLIVEYIHLPYAFLNYHYVNTQYYLRIRLTTWESSMTVPLIVCYGGLSCYYAFILQKKIVVKIFTAVMSLLFIITCGSKTIWLVAGSTIGILFLLRMRRLNRNKLIAASLGGIILGIIVSFVFQQLYAKMMVNTDSTGVRSVQLLAGIRHALRYPFGMGGSIYMQTYKEMYVEAYEFLRSFWLGRKLTYYEVLEVVNANDDKAVGVIAGLWNQSLIWGILGSGYWAAATFRSVLPVFRTGGKDRIFLQITFIGMIVMWLFTTSINNCYFLWGFLIFLQVYFAEGKKDWE